MVHLDTMYSAALWWWDNLPAGYLEVQAKRYKHRRAKAQRVL